MKITDLHVAEVRYNQLNEIDDIIANLRYPQKYIQLKLGDQELYNLKITETHRDKFIVEIDGRVRDGRR